jgi:hypothetical protein
LLTGSGGNPISDRSPKPFCKLSARGGVVLDGMSCKGP